MKEPTFFSDTCTFSRLGQAPEIFFRKISVKKKIGPLSRAKKIFFQKFDFWCFHIHIYKNVFSSSQTCFGSGQTWHMTKFIFQKKDLVS